MKLKLYETLYHPDMEEYKFIIPNPEIEEDKTTLYIKKFNDEIRFEIPIHNGRRKEIEKKDFKKYINNLKFVKLLNQIYEDNFYDIIAKLNKLV